MVFSTNRNRQFYVVSSLVDRTPSAKGELQLQKTEDGKKIYFRHMGEGGIVATDMIDLELIEYARLTPAEKMAVKLKKAVIKVDPSKIEAGQNYVVKLWIRGYIAPGVENVLIKEGLVHATEDMKTNVSLFYETMCKSFQRAFSHVPSKLFKFTYTANDMTITEEIQPWILGVKGQETVDFDVHAEKVNDSDWALVNGVAKEEIPTVDSNITLGNGHMIADMEYFYHGERGDQTRMMGWPDVMYTKYMVVPEKNGKINEYDVFDLHYSYRGVNMDSYKSEKEMTFVAEKGKDVLADLHKALYDMGVTVLPVVESTSEGEGGEEENTTTYSVANPQPTSSNFAEGTYYVKNGDEYEVANTFDSDVADANGYYVED